MGDQGVSNVRSSRESSSAKERAVVQESRVQNRPWASNFPSQCKSEVRLEYASGPFRSGLAKALKLGERRAGWC